MSELQHLVVAIAAQDLEQMIYAKTLSGSVGGTQGFLCGFGAIERIDRLQACVAVAAGRRQAVAKVSQ